MERRVQAACREGIRRGWVRSAHDCAEGGLSVALAECCISGKRGADVVLETVRSLRWDEVLFGEAGNRIVVSVSADNVTEWEAYLNGNLSNTWSKIGTVSARESSLEISTSNNLTLINVKIINIKNVWYRAIQNRLATS